VRPGQSQSGYSQSGQPQQGQGQSGQSYQGQQPQQGQDRSRSGFGAGAAAGAVAGAAAGAGAAASSGAGASGASAQQQGSQSQGVQGQSAQSQNAQQDQGSQSGQNQQHSVQNASNQQGNQFQGQGQPNQFQGSQSQQNQPQQGQYQAGQSQQFQQQNGAQNNNVQNSGFAQGSYNQNQSNQNQQYSESNTSDALNGFTAAAASGFSDSPYANGQTPFNQPEKPKRPFFATPAGWSVIAGAVALLIIIILVLIFTLPRGSSNAAASESPAESSSAAQASSESSASSSPAELKNVEAKLPSGDFKEYKGKDKQTIDIEKPKGNDSKAIVYYEFTPSKESNSRHSLEGRTGDDKTSSFALYTSALTKDKISGTLWMDLKTSSPTRKVNVDSEGEWLIRVYDASSAPKISKGEKISAAFNSYAVIYSGGSGTLEAGYERRPVMNLRVMDAARSNDVILESSTSEFQGTAKFDASEDVYLAVNSFQGTWNVGIR